MSSRRIIRRFRGMEDLEVELVEEKMLLHVDARVRKASNRAKRLELNSGGTCWLEPKS